LTRITDYRKRAVSRLNKMRRSNGKRRTATRRAHGMMALKSIAKKAVQLLHQPPPTMQAKFTIEYTIFPQHNKRVERHFTDDPVEAEDFLMHLLVSGARISAIKHDGIDLDETKSDRMLRVAASRLASQLLENSLHLDAAAVKHRFGLAA
jgi:hypothetical protein